MRLRVAGLIVAAPIIAMATRARADDFHYQSLIVGERALGLGGAFSGLADDPSASFYNPAGLAHFSVSQLSASLSVYTLDHHEVVRGFGSQVGVADLTSDDSPTIPIFVGLVKKFGPRDRFGIRRFAFGLSTLVPDMHNLSYSVDLQNPATMVDEVFRLDLTDRTIWFGPSFAWRLSPTFAIGASAFLSTRSMSHREDRTEFTEGARDPLDHLYRNSTLSVGESSVSITARHVVVRVGALASLGRHWRLGVMVQPPGIPVGGHGEISERRSFARLDTDPATATYFQSTQGGLDVDLPVPWQLRAGLGFVGGDVFSADLDVALYGPSGSSRHPIDVIDLEGRHADPVTNDTPQPGDLFLASFHRQVTFNVSLGTEMLIEHLVPLRLGVFTNRSAAPPITAPTNQYAPPDVDQWGGSVAVGIRSGDYDVSVGVAAIYGRGDGLRLNPEPGGAVLETFLPTRVEDRTVYFFLSGHRRAIFQLAREAYHEVF